MISFRPSQIRPEFKSRFFARIEASGGPQACHPWRGKPSQMGYGKFHVQLHGSKTSFQVYSHRLAWLFRHGEFPKQGRKIAHLCGNRLCCNPAHLAYKAGEKIPVDTLQPFLDSLRCEHLSADVRITMETRPKESRRGCLIWKDSPRRKKSMHGKLRFLPLHSEIEITLPVARIAWLIAHDSLPGKHQHLVHTCQDARCVNPTHLQIRDTVSASDCF